MKVLLFNGSTRNNGCTYLALDQVAQTLRQAGIETELLQLGASLSEIAWAAIAAQRTASAFSQRT